MTLVWYSPVLTATVWANAAGRDTNGALCVNVNDKIVFKLFTNSNEELEESCL